MIPEPDHVSVSKSKGITIEWKDGHKSVYSLAWLRDHCPCATCTGAHGTEPQRTNYAQTQANPFQLYRPAPKMLGVEPVGHYAIRIQWNDGHNTGIYSWDVFRRICPCEECRKARESAEAFTR